MDSLNLARVFVKTVVRMFYETEHIVIVDALVFHGALSLADIAIVLEYGKQLKNAQKLCGRLKEAGLISVFARAELRDGAMKAITREYYYIDYRRAIDATKYRLHMLDERIKENTKPSQEKKEFACPQCKAQWTTMEVLDNIDPFGRASGFLCCQCNHPLDSLHTNGAVEPENDDTPAKFNRQFGPLLKLMQQIDQIIIPAIDGEEAVQNAIELPRDKEINPAAKHEPVMAPNSRPTAVRGIATAPEKIEVSIATDKEYTEAERTVEAERLSKIALQNQLPEWHTKSTVSDKDYYAGGSGPKPVTNGVSTPDTKVDVTEGEFNEDPTLDAYFVALAEEKKRQALQDLQEAKEALEDDDDEDDEDEFEDVVGIAPVEEAPAAKRVKVESPVKGATPASVAVPSPAGDGAESDEDDEEFESVV